jgi:GNAT superfamily N-acetyltransferase
MNAHYDVTGARPHDVSRLAAIERAAAALLRPYAPASILDETTSDDDFRAAQVHGRLWVALADDVPVGFALVKMLASDLPHLEETDVDPVHGRRGLGTALVRAVCAWVARSGFPEITLTTFRAVPWNMPFYARIGFREVPERAWRSEVLAIVRDEAARGLDPNTRVVMAHRPLSGS